MVGIEKYVFSARYKHGQESPVALSERYDINAYNEALPIEGLKRPHAIRMNRQMLDRGIGSFQTQPNHTVKRRQKLVQKFWLDSHMMFLPLPSSWPQNT